jgi:hypothetical protein
MPSAKEVSAHILALREEKKLLTIGLLWSWWNAHNEANVGEQRDSTEEIIYRARVTLLPSARDTGDVAPKSKQRVWKAPPEGVWKINVDGSAGDASAAGVGCIGVVTEALCAEAHACIAGLHAAPDWGTQNVILQTDSQILVKALQT